MDPEEALRLKAEAARIAAEVFASAGSAAEAPDEDGEPTKANSPQLTCCSSQSVILTEDGAISLLPRSLLCLVSEAKSLLARSILGAGTAG